MTYKIKAGKYKGQKPDSYRIWVHPTAKLWREEDKYPKLKKEFKGGDFWFEFKTKEKAEKFKAKLRKTKEVKKGLIAPERNILWVKGKNIATQYEGLL